MNRKLSERFYFGQNVVKIAVSLLGKILFTQIDGRLCGGIITETEAYDGRTDKACHAYPNKMTPRTETMYRKGGCAYVYLCYGIHHLFNIVTNIEGNADAVLIRSIQPVIGERHMIQRRKMKVSGPLLSAGPGRLSQALGITTHLDGTSLMSQKIWIEESSSKDILYDKVAAGPRIGVQYADEDAQIPWRFYFKDCQFVS